MKFAATSVTLLSLFLLSCDSGEQAAPAPEAKKPTCDQSLDSLTGDWARIVSTPNGDALDGLFRVRFNKVEPGGTPTLIATAGTLNKMTYSLAEKKEGYVIFLQDRDIADIEKFKAENKDPNRKMQGKMKVVVDAKKCRLKIDDMYLTYVDGQPQEHFNEAMSSFYAKADKTYSFDQCTDAFGLRYSDKPVDPTKVKAASKSNGPLQERISAGVPSYFYQFVPTSELDPACQMSFDVYEDNARILENQTAVADGKDGKVLNFEHTFQPSGMGIFVELHRYKNCNGQKSLVSVSCGVVLPQ